MNFFEAIKALSERKPVRMVRHPGVVFRVEDFTREIDGNVHCFCEIKAFDLKGGDSVLRDSPKEMLASFSREAVMENWELAPPFEV